MDILLWVAMVATVILTGAYLMMRRDFAENDRHIAEDKRNAERRAKELAERLKNNPAEVETITVMKFPAATLNGKDVIVLPSDVFEDLKASLQRRKAREAAE